MIALILAGAGIVLAGLVAIGFGIPIKEFSFGNTMILSGVIVACTGAVVAGLGVVGRELKAALTRTAPQRPAGPTPFQLPASLNEPGIDGATPPPATATEGNTPKPWFAEAAARNRPTATAPAVPPAAPPPRRRRSPTISGPMFRLAAACPPAGAAIPLLQARPV